MRTSCTEHGRRAGTIEVKTFACLVNYSFYRWKNFFIPTASFESAFQATSYNVDFLKVLSNNSSLACCSRDLRISSLEITSSLCSREIHKSRINKRSTCGKSTYNIVCSKLQDIFSRMNDSRSNIVWIETNIVSGHRVNSYRESIFIVCRS